MTPSCAISVDPPSIHGERRVTYQGPPTPPHRPRPPEPLNAPPSRPPPAAQAPPPVGSALPAPRPSPAAPALPPERHPHGDRHPGPTPEPCGPPPCRPSHTPGGISTPHPCPSRAGPALPPRPHPGGSASRPHARALRAAALPPKPHPRGMSTPTPCPGPAGSRPAARVTPGGDQPPASMPEPCGPRPAAQATPPRGSVPRPHAPALRAPALPPEPHPGGISTRPRARALRAPPRRSPAPLHPRPSEPSSVRSLVRPDRRRSGRCRSEPSSVQTVVRPSCHSSESSAVALLLGHGRSRSRPPHGRRDSVAPGGAFVSSARPPALRLGPRRAAPLSLSEPPSTVRVVSMVALFLGHARSGSRRAHGHRGDVASGGAFIPPERKPAPRLVPRRAAPLSLSEPPSTVRVVSTVALFLGHGRLRSRPPHGRRGRVASGGAFISSARQPPRASGRAGRPSGPG
ncbi:hypothetical protein DFJ69_4755 [Thermomonospora umbrina]|uniref:Uncharacterized protein n=1 Tax=Thermomonospora umbrina TaxID=111806 RepID=A0A3D9SUG2_9ACTN|nr:hypothetical protein DFJ69_4755 [Thermomonospora umbrina]